MPYRDTLTLAKRADTQHFVYGMHVHWPYWYQYQWWRNLWRKATWWRHPRSIVVDIDVEAGTISTEPLVWSWRRWAWVRLWD